MKPHCVAINQDLDLNRQDVRDPIIASLKRAVEADGNTYAGYDVSTLDGKTILTAKVLTDQNVVS